MAALKRRILVECGAAETRAALLLGEEVLRFWFGPARGDEALPRAPQPGQVFLGRVRSVSTSLNAAFVDVGGDPPGFLPLDKENAPHEGAAIVVAVRRPAIGAKGPLLTREWRVRVSASTVATIEQAATMRSAPAPLGPPKDAVLEAVLALGGAADEIIVDSADAATHVRTLGATSLNDCPFGKFGVEDALDKAFDPAAPLNAGARLIVDETEAATVVDVDSGSASSGATGRLNDKVNATAAACLFGELSRRGVGGRVLVDFLPPSSAAARQQLMDALRKARRDVYDCRLGRLSADGLFDLTAPREFQSLLELATEPLASKPRAGRRFTLDWQAKAAIRAAEQRLGSLPGARVRLFAGEELHSYVTQQGRWIERVAARFGTRLQIGAAAGFSERSFEIAEQA